jgi:GNAT superfamily N-acetyltransferase
MAMLRLSQNDLDVAWVVKQLQYLRGVSDELARHADDPEHVTYRLTALKDNPQFQSIELVNDQHEMVGCAFGIMSDTWFSKEVNFYELFVYVEPKYRSLRNAKLLIRGLEAIARDAGCEYLETGASTHIRDKTVLAMYELFGYTPHGGGMRKRLNV